MAVPAAVTRLHAARRVPAAAIALLALGALAAASLFVGVSPVRLSALLSGDASGHDLQVLLASRIPRTLAAMLAGASMAIAGLVMQLIARNRYVEPTTVGTADSAALGFLTATLLVPGWPMMAKMLVSACFALAGTALFLRILRAVPLRDAFLPPLVGVMLGGVIGAATTFLAYRHELMGTMLAWRVGDFSGVLSGRYELLWIGLAGLVVAWIAADRFTVAGLGRELTTSLGLDYRRVVMVGLAIVAVTSAVVLVSVGIIPFLGLVVPNVVSLLVGDNMRRAVPWVAAGGAGFVLACDIFGRLVRAPYEIPISVVVGVVGSGIFLWLLLRRRHGAG